MKLGVFTPLFSHLTFDELLETVSKHGLKAVELGTGGNPGNHHCDMDALLEDASLRKEMQEKLDAHGIVVSAFSCHNNPLSPNKEEAKLADETLRKTMKLASLMNVPVVNTFSGIPGDSDDATYPNWPIIPWPTEYKSVYDWQWETKIIPYWKEIGTLAERLDVKVAIELHGGFSAHTPYTILKLRENTSNHIGVNFDPSHLWWQGIDPVAAIKLLDDAIFHVHAKDIYLDQDNINMYGLTDMQDYGDVKTRAWTFRTVGYGHDLKVWSDIISHLKMYGYDYIISIEHEDPLMSVEEGFSKAVKNLQGLLIEETLEGLWWT